MTYKQIFKPHKFGETADVRSIDDTGNPYQNLANGIVLQAAEDYIAAYRYILTHPDPIRIVSYLTQDQIDVLNEPYTQTKYEKLKVSRLKCAYKQEEYWYLAYRTYWTMERQKRIRATREYKAYIVAERSWVNAFAMIDDCREFFNGDWIKLLTDLDGPILLKQIEKIVREEINEHRS